MIEQFHTWKVECVPFEKGPIRSMTIIVEAKNRKEAELILLDTKHKFFDQDITQLWSEPFLGYRKL